MNTLVTAMHATLILAYTVLSFIAFNLVLASITSYRYNTAWLFFGGILDIVLAFLMFFILDDEVNIIRDESTQITYAVLDVINMEAPHQSD